MPGVAYLLAGLFVSFSVLDPSFISVANLLNIGIQSSTLLPLASCIASTTPARPSTAPIDRSNPSLMMINVIGSASSSSVEVCVPMLRRFGTDMKLGSSTENATRSAASR